MLKLWIFISFIKTAYELPSNTRKTGFVSGHLMIGALFPIHEQPTLNGSYSRECGEIREEYGMHRVEVLLKTIKEINENPNILPTLTLGVDIRDSCWYAPIALEQSIDFIKNSLSLQEKSQVNFSKPIVGLIGPAASEVTVQVQNLLQLFKIPQIGYSATSIDLSSKNSYKYFMRVVPSDILQVKALINLLTYFKWSYISLLNSKGSYGEEGIKELQEHLKNTTDICTDEGLEIDNKEEAHKFDALALKLFKKGKPKVILCFCQGDTVTKLLRSMTKLNMTKKGYLIIGTDGWADRTDILGTIENGRMELSEAALGSITIRLHSKPIPDFDDYFRTKTSSSTPGNPWFQEFWEKKFNCHINKTKSDKYPKTCTRKESLFNMPYVQDSKLGFVVKSVMTIAWGLHNIYQKVCIVKNFTLEGCANFILRNGKLLLDEMIDLKFSAYDNETVRFDSKGDPPGRYDIMNYQYGYNEKTNRTEYHYERIGSWKENHLVIEDHLIQWPKSEENERNNQTSIKSHCSDPCKFDQIRIFRERKKCCWTCKDCSENEITNKTFHNESCSSCKKGFRPNSDRSNCSEIPAIFLKWSDASVIVAIIFSIVGLIITIIIVGIFAKYNNTPVVKSCTRELMYVILVGVALSYLTTFPLVWKPTTFSCLLSRIMPGLSFSLIFGSLVTKTNRICRILSISKKKIIRRKGRFLTTTAQIVIVFLLNVVEIIIISVMIWHNFPKSKSDYSVAATVRLICNTESQDLFISMGFDAVLVCFCTWYAFKTRNLPENFNEAKFIGFTMYTTCIIWIGLVVIYLSTNLKEISLCFAMHFTATICIVFLFLPKLYIILFKPERNERSAFTTTTEIRCHIGSGKTEYECSKNKSDKRKSNSNANFRYLSDERKSSMFRSQTDICLIEQISSRENGLLTSPTNRESKFIQTEFSLVMEFLLNLCRSLHCNNEELTISQIALLQFLKDNWNKDHIPQLQKLNFCDRHSGELTGSDVKFMDEDQILDNFLDETDVDNSSLKHPLNRQCNSVLTCSPISNASTNASSTITSLFLEYLQMHGKQFKNINDKRSVKL